MSSSQKHCHDSLEMPVGSIYKFKYTLIVLSIIYLWFLYFSALSFLSPSEKPVEVSWLGLISYKKICIWKVTDLFN